MVRRRVWVIATDSAGCFWYRLHLPLTHLDQDRYEVIWRPPTSAAELRPGDIVIGQRIAGHNTAWQEMCVADGVTTVYDLDDDLLDIDPANVVPHSIYAPMREDTITNIKLADLVTVTTPRLAEKIRQFNTRTVVLENCLPSHWVAPPRTLFSSTVPPVVGWAGSMFHQQDWSRAVLDALGGFSGEVPGAQFHSIGAGYMTESVRARVTGWGNIEGYGAALDFDIGIAPLAHTPFNHSKSWVKLLEYASKGIPSIASAVGQYWDVPYGVALLVTEQSAQAWFEPLMALGTGTKLRRAMSRRASAWAADWTIDKQVHRWAAAYENGA